MAKVPSNTSLCQILKQEAEKRDNPYSRRAYERAYDLCMDFSEPITSGKQLREFRGIGPKIEAVVDQYLQNPTPQSPRQTNQALDLFTSITGVGPETARKWIQKGYTSLEDLPIETLPKEVQLGIEYYDDLQERIPRAEIELWGDVLERWLQRDLQKHQTRFIIAGSYRRGQETSGDIDILVVGNLDIVLKCPIFTHTIVKGNKKWRGLGIVDQRYRRIDLEQTTESELPFALFYFTGSKNHNTWMRTKAKEKGYTLNEKGLFRDGERIEGLKTEADISDFLGLEYFDPVDRN